MIVIVSWYADGSGQPQVNFDKVSYRVASGLYGVGQLVGDVRNTRDKECRIWEIWDEDFHLIYDSTDQKQQENNNEQHGIGG